MKLITDKTLTIGDTFQSGITLGSKIKFNLLRKPHDTVWKVDKENKTTFRVRAPGVSLYLHKEKRTLSW